MLRRSPWCATGLFYPNRLNLEQHNNNFDIISFYIILCSFQRISGIADFTFNKINDKNIQNEKWNNIQRRIRFDLFARFLIMFRPLNRPRKRAGPRYRSRNRFN